MNAPLRRGACPGLSAPMQTGDGLLVRLRPIGTIAVAALTGLCAAARAHGNGVVEVTARGSIQVRGLTAASAPRFAAAVGALGIAAESGVPVHTNPLAGLDAEEIFDASALAADLRQALARSNLAARLSPKISVAVDGGGTLDLNALSADVRLSAELINDRVALRLSVAGDGAGAADIGAVKPADAVAAAIRVLEVIAQRDRTARARDVLAAEGAEPFRAAVASLLISDAPRARAGKTSDAIGPHRLRDGSFAYGAGLAFGHAGAASLQDLAAAAAAAGTDAIRAAPGRALIAVGLAQETLPSFVSEAERLGFIVRAGDPRRHVVACAGAPICTSAFIAARAMAPVIAEKAARLLDGSLTIHLSGCTKGCAHCGAAALTVVGTPEGCALVANGSARDAPFAVVAPNDLAAAIARHARPRMREAGHV